MKASAYLSVFDDYALLGPAMAKIAPRLDEIIVVDGAYRWMAPVFAGRDPARSVDALRDVMAPYAHKTRWINRLWDDESAKRRAGYAACSHRWIWRLDADEIHFIDDAALDRFFASGLAVAEMQLPLMVAPGVVRGVPGQRLDCNSLLFDSHQVDAAAHLAHLWLVMPEAERAQIPAASGGVGAEPIAFTAHLTEWRPPAAAAIRARFYVMNWLREHGAARPGAVFRHDPAAGFGPMLRDLPPGALMETLLGHAIVAGLPQLGAQSLLPAPLTAPEIASFAPLHTALLDGLAALNQALAARPRWVLTGVDCFVDLSTAAARAPLLQDGALRFVADAPLAAGRATLCSLYADAPFAEEETLAVAIDGTVVHIPWRPAPRAPVRQALRLSLWAASGAGLIRLRAGA